ncbi:MAG: hypothetical protein JJU26_13415 [Oceanicaulis sp.]|nr:hypothetical protein [Oceanicaulis sp.]
MGFEPRFLEHLDGRTVAARVLRQRLAEIHADLGGESSLSYAQRSLVRQAVWLESWLESQHAEAATGKAVDIGRMTQALNSLLGLWRTIGIERRARDVPDLQTYLGRKASA